MTSFLWWIGAYNTLGSLFLIALTRESFANTVLAKWVHVITVPYTHGSHGRMWIWWSVTCNLGVGAIMMLASRWPRAMQVEVTTVVVAIYSIMLVVAAVAMRLPGWSAKGIAGTLVLWVGQIAWGVVALVR